MIAMRTLMRTKTARAGLLLRPFSTAVAKDNTPRVAVDRFVASPPQSEQNTNKAANIERLPNDVHERNAIYNDEDQRTMAGITASVRHVSICYVKDGHEPITPVLFLCKNFSSFIVSNNSVSFVIFQ